MSSDKVDIRVVGRREALGIIGAMSANLALCRDPGQPRSAVSLSNDVLPTTELRHGAYVCIGAPRDRRALSEAPVEELARRLGFQNEFEAKDGHPTEAFAFLRRVDVTPAQVADERLSRAEMIAHVGSPSAARVEQFCAEISAIIATTPFAVLQGVVRPPSFTGGAMHNFAYAQQRQQQPGDVMPHAYIVPMRKTAEWWAKSWMERHTYFLPRYDDAGRMLHEGHALAAAAGIPHLMRRTYKHAISPAPEGAYDFLNYFECAEESTGTFLEVCAALRDIKRNPEWRFVREGPTWHGRRVHTWSELFGPGA